MSNVRIVCAPAASAAPSSNLCTDWPLCRGAPRGRPGRSPGGRPLRYALGPSLKPRRRGRCPFRRPAPGGATALPVRPLDGGAAETAPPLPRRATSPRLARSKTKRTGTGAGPMRLWPPSPSAAAAARFDEAAQACEARTLRRCLAGDPQKTREPDLGPKEGTGRELWGAPALPQPGRWPSLRPPAPQPSGPDLRAWQCLPATALAGRARISLMILAQTLPRSPACQNHPNGFVAEEEITLGT